MLVYISECCSAPPATELDMTTVKYGGPSGFCGRCFDNCTFIIPCYNCGDEAILVRDDGEIYCVECSAWINSMGVKGDSDGKHKD